MECVLSEIKTLMIQAMNDLETTSKKSERFKMISSA
jgi:hypothetical protein